MVRPRCSSPARASAPPRAPPLTPAPPAPTSPPPPQSSAECEETIRRIRSHRGVKGVVIVDNAGVPIYSSLSAEETTDYAAHISQLASKARGVVRSLDPENDLTFLRIRSKKHEIMVSPDKDYSLIVIQNPNEMD